MSSNFPMVPTGTPLPTLPRSPQDVLRWAADFSRAAQHLYRVLATRLEQVLLSGTAAEQPAADGSRRFYWATDTNTLYFDEGTWVAVGGSGGGNDILDWLGW